MTAYDSMAAGDGFAVRCLPDRPRRYSSSSMSTAQDGRNRHRTQMTEDRGPARFAAARPLPFSYISLRVVSWSHTSLRNCSTRPSPGLRRGGNLGTTERLYQQAWCRGADGFAPRRMLGVIRFQQRGQAEAIELDHERTQARNRRFQLQGQSGPCAGCAGTRRRRCCQLPQGTQAYARRHRGAEWRRGDFCAWAGRE